jgi:hypothetical protein
MRRTISIGFTSLFMIVAAASAAIRHVPAEYPTIQAAIDDANGGDTILVAPGTYTGPGNRDIDLHGKAITIASEGGPKTCVIDCNGTEIEPHRGFILRAGKGIASIPSPAWSAIRDAAGDNAVVDGFTIMNGNVPQSGGGVYAEYGTIRNCILMRNTARDGGGIFVSNGVVVNCLIVYNVAGGGGGVSADRGDPIFLNCTIAANRGGGVVLGLSGTATMENSIIVANRTLSGDQIEGGPGTVLEAGMTLKVSNCCIQPSVSPLSWVSGQARNQFVLWSDPRFVDVNNGDFRLQPDSPCVDKGTSTTSVELPDKDIAGSPRVSDGDRDGTSLPDIGAYEVPAPDQPYIWVSKPLLEFRAPAGGPDPAAQTLTVQNLGLNSLDWTMESDCDWLFVSPQDASSGSAPVRVTVGVHTQALGPGTFTGNLIVSSEQALNSPQTIPVTLYLAKTLRVPADFATIQEAIDAASSCDTILVGDGIHRGPGNHDVDFRGKAITVRSENGPENCTVDGGGANRGFLFISGEDEYSILEGFTIVGPPRTIVCEGASPTVRNCRFEGHVVAMDSAWGDPRMENCFFADCVYALLAEGSNPTLSGCSLRNCDTGVYCRSGGVLRLVDCRIVGSRREAIYVHGCAVAEITRCTLAGNAKNREVPAMSCYGGRLTMERCTISGNHAGLLFKGCTSAVIRNSVLCGNGHTADATAYGVSSEHSDLLIDNCTLAGNAGLVCDWWPSIDPQSHITNSILWGSVPNPIQAPPGSIAITYSDVQDGWPGGGNLSVDPCFVSSGTWDPNGTPDNPDDDFWVDGDYHLKSQAGHGDPINKGWVLDEVTSPCIDRGDPNSPIGEEPFPNGGRINMGAYGGTAEASKSWFDEPPCETVIAGDINGDCRVDFADLALLARHWLEGRATRGEQSSRSAGGHSRTR